MESLKLKRIGGNVFDWPTIANDPELLHSCLKSGAFHSQSSGGTIGSCDDPSSVLQSGENLLALDLFKNPSNVSMIFGLIRALQVRNWCVIRFKL